MQFVVFVSAEQFAANRPEMEYYLVELRRQDFDVVLVEQVPHITAFFDCVDLFDSQKYRLLHI